MRIDDPAELRLSLANFVNGNMEARRIYTDILQGVMPFDSFVARLRKTGTWQGTEAAVFICLMFSINIVIVSNAKCGIFCDNIRLWEKINFIEEDAPTIYLYYHLHKKPFFPSGTLDHYGYLYEYEGSNPEIFEIYRNQRSGTELSTIDLSNGGGEVEPKITIDFAANDDEEHDVEPPSKRNRKIVASVNKKKSEKRVSLKKRELDEMKKNKQSFLNQYLVRMK